MYDNISQLRFEKGSSQEPLATAMISSEGETMVFKSSVMVEGKVEDWMTCVLDEMRRTNRLITKECIFTYCHEKSRYQSDCYVCTCTYMYQLLEEMCIVNLYIYVVA